MQGSSDNIAGDKSSSSEVHTQVQSQHMSCGPTQSIPNSLMHDLSAVETLERRQGFPPPLFGRPRISIHLAQCLDRGDSVCFSHRIVRRHRPRCRSFLHRSIPSNLLPSLYPLTDHHRQALHNPHLTQIISCTTIHHSISYLTFRQSLGHTCIKRPSPLQP